MDDLSGSPLKLRKRALVLGRHGYNLIPATCRLIPGSMAGLARQKAATFTLQANYQGPLAKTGDDPLLADGPLDTVAVLRGYDSCKSVVGT